MKRYLIATALLVGLGAAGIALADSDDCRVPMADWQPREAVQKMAEAQGWTVRRIKTDDGCYEVKGRDETGRAFKVKIDPATLAVVKLKFEDDEDDDEDDEGGKQRSRSNSAPAGSVAPPANGLFTPGTAPVVKQ